MSKSTIGTIAVLILLAALILLFGGDLTSGLMAGLVAGTVASASYAHSKKKQEEEKEEDG